MFSEEIQYQLDFAKNSTIFPIVAHTDDTRHFDLSLSKLKNLINTNISKLSIVSYNEVFKYTQHLDKINKLLSNTDIEYYISASTSTKYHNFFNPLVNIYFWKNCVIRSNVNWSSDYTGNTQKLFDKDNFKNFNKEFKGILSIRKESPLRNYLDSIIDKENFCGIYRYIKYPASKKIELDKNKIQNLPTMTELLNEYKKSYVSFIVETSTGPHFLNILTEKTLIAFLTKTIPIVLGGKFIIKELKDMGFYVWNDEFDFGDGDLDDTASGIKIEKFNRCIENYNKMSKSDIADMYNSNIDKIENNYKIVSELLFDKKTIL